MSHQFGNSPQRGVPPYEIGGAFLLHEYSALRDEIVKQTEIEFQLTAFTLVVASAFLSVSIGTDINGFVPLLYPVVSVFLAIQWISRIRIETAIADYIIETHEQRLSTDPLLGWERRSRITLRGKHKIFPLSLIGAKGLYVSTQSLAIVTAIYRTHQVGSVWKDLLQGAVPSVLLQPVGLVFVAACVVDITIVVLTFSLLHNEKASNEKASNEKASNEKASNEKASNEKAE